MAEEEINGKSDIDPFAQMFEYYDMMSKSWSKVMSDSIASKNFAESMGEQIEGSLDAFSLMRRQFTDVFEQYMQQMNFPTRNELVNLSQRLTKIEMDLDDLHSKIDELLDLTKEK